ncbi:diaminopimelate epimerase [Lactobacillus sp. PV037]|uniref:diaminopimelate epimerase n=1 Tax=unclassified Lactobacillus TaxID=2620435 RepID=UPI00223FEC78|nr:MULTISPECIES: diaminopimelate epimerase [unclassified Lactobacillus]QNQ82057.1 diaminopimelate epimerase [Lactobacillus sp. PV012]QNQ83908.1 diaminopimelate epimerase [Lactobacillus sp. PV037]
MVELIKVHGSQNQFFILDQETLSQKLNDKELKELALALTNHKTGLLHGSDGLLVVDKASSDALAQMRVINADGSEASMCGNGLRTVARYLHEKTGQTEFKVQTMKADLNVRKFEDFAHNVPAFAVEISPVSFNAASLPFKNLGRERLINDFVPEIYPGLKFTSLAVPNPHLISFMSQEQIESNILGGVGSYLNGDNPYYPDGVNVNFAQIIDKNKIFVRTFERGVGFTNACGTGMSATSLALALTHPEAGELEQTITVYNPGGFVKTIPHYDALHHRYWIELIGNATFTDKINISEEDLKNHNFTHAAITSTNEQDAYLNFVNNLPHFNNVTSL